MANLAANVPLPGQLGITKQVISFVGAYGAYSVEYTERCSVLLNMPDCEDIIEMPEDRFLQFAADVRALETYIRQNQRKDSKDHD